MGAGGDIIKEVQHGGVSEVSEGERIEERQGFEAVWRGARLGEDLGELKLVGFVELCGTGKPRESQKGSGEYVRTEQGRIAGAHC